MEPVVKAWDDNPELLEFGGRGLLYGLLDVIVDGHLDLPAAARRPGRGGRGPAVRRAAAVRTPTCSAQTYELRRQMTGVRKVVLPMRDVADTMLRHAEAAPRERADRAATGPARPRDPRERVERHAARRGHDDLRDQAVAGRRPAQPGRPQAVRLGGDHRGADRGHRLLRPERALPRVRPVVGVRGQHASSRCCWPDRLLGVWLPAGAGWL